MGWVESKTKTVRENERDKDDDDENQQEIDRETNLGMNHGDVFQHIKNNQRQLFQCIIKSYCHVSEM